MKITDLLSHGQANAVPLRDLEGITGLDGRTVRAMISAERRAGAAILSDNATGYYLPANEEEKARFVRSMRHRAKEILCAADAVERAQQMREIELAGKYIKFAKIIGERAAAELYREEITRAKKKDRIRRLKEKLLELPAADVGTAYKNVLALETAKGKATATGNAWRAEKIIYQIQILEMEI